MISLLARLFIHTDPADRAGRRVAYGVLCGAVGISLNLLLFGGKLLAGAVSHSIAITADAFNNLSDAASSAVTLLGFQLGRRKPDAEHPFGHGRIEYLSGLAVSVLILLMGLDLLEASLRKLLRPTPAEYQPLAVVILCVSILVKLYIAWYNRCLGRQLDSPAMQATAVDALGDCVSTSLVLAAALLGRFAGLPVDGWCGLLVSVLILWSGARTARDTAAPLLGAPPTPEFVGEIRSLVLSHPEIIGVHDLIVHDYGPSRRMVSLHAEISAEGDILDIHDRIDRIERELRQRLGCEAVIHMDPVAADGGETRDLRRRVEILARCIDEEISLHDFRVSPEGESVSVCFDVEVPYRFRLTDRQVEEKLGAVVCALDERYRAVIRVERSYIADVGKK